MKTGLYAIIFEETKQVLFNVTQDYLKKHPRHVIQEVESAKTLRQLEKKYKVKIEQRELPNYPNTYGYFAVQDAQPNLKKRSA